MALPTHPLLHRSILEIAAETKKTVSAGQILERLIGKLSLTQDDLDERTSTGASRIRANLGFGLSYLARAGLLQRPERGQYKITDVGKATLNQTDVRLSFSLLSRRISGDIGNQEENKAQADEDLAPEFRLEKIIDSEEAVLVRVIQAKLHILPFDKFEKLVGDVLERMGYGRSEFTPISHDGGIDVVLSQDTLGLERVYVQAKRWENRSVGSPEINKFVGSLDSHDASKGIVVTSSTFSEPAKHAADRNKNYIIRLVDGEELARLMVKHNIGVKTIRSFDLKDVDEDYFSEER